MNELAIAPELKELTPEKSAQIKAVFDPMVTMLESFEEAFNTVTAEEVTPDTCKRAKRLRLDIGKIRIEADKKHKELKAEALRTGRAIDGIRNILKFAVVDKEEKLKEIETTFERQEAERLKALQEEREEELHKYNPDHPFIDLGGMTEEVWTNFIAGTKSAHEEKVKAEKKAEEARLAAEEAERAENERIRVENEKLRIEAEEREKQIEAERLKKEKALEKERAEVAAREEKARIEAEEIQKKQDQKIKEEREAREKLEAEAKQKEQEEADRLKAEEERKAKEEADRLKAEKKAANAPDKDKLLTIADNLLMKLDLFSSEEAKTAMREAATILSKSAESL